MRPTEASQPVLPWLFFREAVAGEGDFVLDDRVIAQRVTEGVRGDGATDLVVRWERGLGENPSDGELSDLDVRNRYGPTVRCLVAEAPFADGGFEAMTVLAHGYVDLAELQFGADSSKTFFRRKLKMRDIVRRTTRLAGAQVYGRYMLSRDGWDHARDNPEESPLDLAWATLAKLVKSAPCIFNPNGRPNRLATPVLYDVEDKWSAGPIHLFTDDRDPDAEYWTYLQALRYLALLYVLYGGDDRVSPAQLFSEALAGPSEAPWWALDESDVALAGDFPVGWREHMTRRCQSLACEGMDTLEAMSALADAAGIQFCSEHVNASAGSTVAARTALRFWAPGDYLTQVLALERPGAYFTGGGAVRTVPEILAHNNVAQCQSAREFGATISRADVLGAAKWRTVVAELKPLWEPDTRWDLLPPLDPEVAVDELRFETYDESAPFAAYEDSDFTRRYDAHGKLFRDGQNAMVGRLWGIDPAGIYDAETYARLTPFDEVYGEPFDVPGAADQVPRRRVIRGIPTVDDHNNRRVILEVNFGTDEDGDLFRFRVESECTVLPEEAAIWLKHAKLLEFASSVLDRETFEGSDIKWRELLEIDNMYHAYLIGRLRLRLIFQIELDERVHEAAWAADSPVAEHEVAHLVVRDRDFQFDEHDEDVPADIVALTASRDDEDSAERFAESLLAQMAGGQWSGRAVIPWIETQLFRLGVPIAGIRRAVTGDIDIPFGGTASLQGLYPQVVQRTMSQGDAGVFTQLVLHDHRFARHMAPRAVRD